MKNLASNSAMLETEVLALVEMAMQGHMTDLNVDQCITGVHWNPAAQVGQGEIGLAIAAIGRTEHVEQEIVLFDGQQLALA